MLCTQYESGDSEIRTARGKMEPKVPCCINAAEYRTADGFEEGVSHSFGVSVGASGALPLWNRGGMFTSASSPAECT